MSKPTITPPCHCPNCNELLTAATSVEQGGRSPEPGDISICINCAAPLVFNDDLTVRALSSEERVDLPHEHLTELNRGIRMVQAMITMRKSAPPAP